MTTTKSVWIIKGHPGGPNGKWEEVQAIQHEPFIFIMYNGSHLAGEEEDDVPALLDMLRKYKLGTFWRNGNCASLNPCHGIVNPEWNWEDKVPHFIDGPRMYVCDGVYRFSGNFENYSHAFGIDTNHGPTIAALLEAIEANDKMAADLPT